MKIQQKRIQFSTLFSLIMALVVGVNGLHAAPADPFNGASASFNAKMDAPEQYNTGDWGVADQRGAAVYTYPIDLPAGRNSMAPSLALRYSSHSPLRGGLAAGWTLDIPSISVDASLGREAVPVYKATLNNVTGRLIEIPDASPYPNSKAYRAQFDDSFTRFFRLGEEETHYEWVALTADGVRHHFVMVRNVVMNGRWYLDRQIDPFGNMVRYHWTLVHAPSDGRRGIDVSLRRIEYSANEQAGLLPHAQIDFVYAPLDLCPGSDVPIGAKAERSGWAVGAERLNAIVVSVRDAQETNWRIRKRIDLHYSKRAITSEQDPGAQGVPASGPGSDDQNTPIPCNQEDAPLRYLTKIQATAWDQHGAESKLPPVAFAYNRQAIDPTRLPIQVHLAGAEHYGARRGANGTLLDIDGDGVQDRISIAAENNICMLTWQRGRLGGDYEALVRRAPLPTAPWHNGSTPNQHEYCNINGQVAYFSEPGESLIKGLVSYHFMDYSGDGRVDLLTHIWAATDHALFTPILPPAGVTAAHASAVREASLPEPSPSVEMITPEGVWRVFENWFPSSSSEPAEYIFTHIPYVVDFPSFPPSRGFPPVLPSSASDEHIDRASLPQSSIPVLTDLDGDGLKDYIDIGAHPNLLTDDGTWDVYLGTSRYGFSETPFSWPVPQIVLSRAGRGDSTDDTTPNTLYQTVVAGLHDMNGDGLPDLLAQTDDLKLKVFYNYGSGFSNRTVELGLHTPLEETFLAYSNVIGNDILDGSRVYIRRLMDIDGDGLVDMVTFPHTEIEIKTGVPPHVHFNIGDRFLPARALPRGWMAAQRTFVAQDGAWQLRSDFMDGSGDGEAELVEWSADGVRKTIYRQDYPPGPKLLRSIDNGRGLRMAFKYAPTTDTTIVTGNQMAHPQWVVAEVKVEGGFGTPALLERYTYEQPVVGSPQGLGLNYAHEQQSFLGFRKTSKTQVTGSDAAPHRVVRAYDYNAKGDPKGRLIQQWTYNGVAASFTLHEYEESTWTKQPLFNGQVSATLRTSAVKRICNSGASDAQCIAQPANTHRRAETWQARCPSQPNPTVCTAPELYVRTLVQTGSGLSENAQDRRTHYGYDIRYGQPDLAAHDYRIQQQQTVFEAALLDENSIVYTVQGRTEVEFNPVTGRPERLHIWQDEKTVASTLFAYDPVTGNLQRQVNPKQAAPGGSGAHTVFTYGDHELFVASVTNELGHQVFTTYDIATGATLERRGPNTTTLVDSVTEWERETWQVDGFGRTLEHAVSTENGASQPYALRVVEKWSYFDFEQPGRVRTEKLQNFDSNTWIIQDRTQDGLGRTLRQIDYTGGPVNAVTIYSYDSAGNRSAVDMPDPRTDSGATVRYTYHYDGLGRLVQFIQPGDNGVAITYNGLVQTQRETTNDNSGGVTTQVFDVFDRLVEVHEQDGAQTIVTHYRYDAHNNLNQVTDADGNVTTFAHDWVGNRTQIVRGDRVWRYVYDLNGNLEARIAPEPPGADTSLYTIRYAYDDLNRPLRVYYAEPQMNSLPFTVEPPKSEEEQHNVMAAFSMTHALFLPMVAQNSDATQTLASAEGAATVAAASPALGSQNSVIEYRYDEGANGIGRLSQVTMPVGTVTYQYDPRGLVMEETRSFSLPKEVTGVNAVQSVKRQYNAQGQLTLSTWNDGQQWQTSYDARGLVNAVAWFDPEKDDWRVVAGYTRSLAGAPRVRHSVYGQTRTYTYDHTGRILSDAISAGGATVANRSYTYDGVGNLKTISGQTGGVSAAASYTYDTLHRLRNAVGPAGYSGAFTYSPAGNILTANVKWNGSSTSRNVRYTYGKVDPQAVDVLADTTTNQEYVSFEYDPAGNMTVRVAPDGTQELVWDALDHLRVASEKKGVEVYYYDHTGARMLAVSATEGVRFWFGERETHYATDGKLVRDYLHLSDGGATVARVQDGKIVEMQYADALQNLMLALDSDGKLTASFFYGPFGEIVQSTGASDHRRQFNGKEHDQFTQLRYYGARYYDALTLRWSSADPLYRFLPEVGLNAPARLNLYAFSLNNPLRYLDPDGRSPVLIKTFWDLYEHYGAANDLSDARQAVADGYAGKAATEGGKTANMQKIAYRAGQRDQMIDQLLGSGNKLEPAKQQPQKTDKAALAKQIAGIEQRSAELGRERRQMEAKGWALEQEGADITELLQSTDLDKEQQSILEDHLQELNQEMEDLNRDYKQNEDEARRLEMQRRELELESNSPV